MKGDRLMRKKNRIVCLLILLILLTGLAGCSLQTDAVDEMVAPEQVQVELSQMRIALIGDPSTSDAYFLSTAYEAFAAKQEEYGFEGKQVTIASSDDWALYIKALASQQYDLIIGIGCQAGKELSMYEEAYQDCTFVVIDSLVTDPDIKAISYNASEGAYVLGAMMATAIPYETTYGYIGNLDNDENYAFQYGFTKGVQSIDPEAGISACFTGSFTDEELSYQCALQLASQGIRCIMGAVSSNANAGIYRAANELADNQMAIYTTGLGYDQTSADNAPILGGLTKDASVAFDALFAELAYDCYSTDTVTLGVEDGGIGILYITQPTVAYQNSLVTEAVIAAGQNALEDILTNNVSLQKN